MPDSTLSTLQNIQNKIRRLVRAPSLAQLSDNDLNAYINTFILYDFPEHLRLFSLRRTLTFYTKGYIDHYTTNTTNPDDPLYNFKNKYITIHEPAYVAGYNVFFSQSREQFYGIYPQINFITQIAAGDGVTTNFTGTLSNVPIQQDNVLFSSLDSTNGSLAIIDVPIDETIGSLKVADDNVNSGQINYITGAYTINFPSAPGTGVAINAQVVPYQPGRPIALLYFNDTFFLRPIPDQPYRVDVEVYIRPTELLDSGDMPELSEWWQYIAYGAAKKVFEDRMDLGSVQLILPEFMKQESLILRRTIVQQTKERTATIYTEQTTGLSGTNGWGWGSGGLY